MTDLEILAAVGVGIILLFVVRATYRRLAFTRAERAFFALAASRGVDRQRAMDFINLARAKGTTAMEEVTAEARLMDDNDLRAARQRAGIAVMERAARDEFKRLMLESDMQSFEAMSEAADAAGTAMLNQYVAPRGPLAPDSPMGVAALGALIDNCNDDIQGVPESERYITSVGRVAAAAAKAR